MSDPNGFSDPQPEQAQPETEPVQAGVELDKKKGWHPSPRAQKVLIIGGAVAALLLAVFIEYYLKFAHMADEKLRNGVFAGTLNIFAAPRIVAVGDHISQSETITSLRENGYTAKAGSATGWYETRPNAIEVFPGPESGSDSDGAVIEFSGNQVSRILSATDHKPRQEYQFAPQLITNLSDQNREKRRMVQFPQIPPCLVDAVVSAEDKHFFSHGGIDLFRMVKAAYVDLKDGRKAQGASTLSMQLARGLWLEPDKKWKRKLIELLLTMHIEHKLSKQQIFTYYANQVYLGRRGTFSVNGFGEASQAYFGKDISQLTVPEAALLAGMVQRPSYYNPYRYPDRALERRNLVLRLMHENGKLSEAQFAAAVAAPIKVSSGDMESISSQYFLDLTNDELQSRVGEREPQGEYVYTTLDPDLQRAAVEAVRIGMQEVDAQLRKKKHADAIPHGQPQVALIALDPHTGEIKALVGGRDYGTSQLNHVTAERQPGSSFKPFVYAAALNTALEGGNQVFTPSSTVQDEPTTFQYGNVQYRPNNFEGMFMGTVTLRQALAHSLNVAAVNVAQAVGYDNVLDIARRAGLNGNIKATPAMALGSYVCTPLEIAGAYTMFANNGTYVKPAMVARVRSGDGRFVYQHQTEQHPALDPRVNYLIVNMMQEVLRSGTGAGVRSRGFRLPAAGKTGTSRDGWFAGFTSRLLCVVWIGFDDYRELGLEGSKSALPVWTEFMKRAAQYRGYRDAKDFSVPSGIVSARVCPESGLLAGDQCPASYNEFYISGSQPTEQCNIHSGASPDVPTVSQSGSFEPLPNHPVFPVADTKAH